MGDICRVCLANNIEGIDIYDNYKGEFNLREIIYELSLVEVSCIHHYIIEIKKHLKWHISIYADVKIKCFTSDFRIVFYCI